MAIDNIEDTVEEIVDELGPDPSGIYSTVRTRLDVLESRLNSPLDPNPVAENPFFVGNTGVTISTGSGIPTEDRADGSMFLRQDGNEGTQIYSRQNGVWLPLNGPLSVGVTGYVTFHVYGITGVQSTDQTIFDEIGALIFDPTQYNDAPVNLNRSFKFRAVLEVATAGQTVTLELYNNTDNVSVAQLTSTSTLPEIKSIILSVPSNLPNSEKLYGIRLKRTGGSVTDLVSCKLARIEVIYS